MSERQKRPKSESQPGHEKQLHFSRDSRFSEKSSLNSEKSALYSEKRQSDSDPVQHPPEEQNDSFQAGELVKNTLNGDLDSFEKLICRYQQAIFNIAYYKSRNLFDAEDLTQDIFMAAYKALSTLKEPDNFGGWLIGIAHNRCHKWFRRERTKVLKFKELRERKEREDRLRERSRNEDTEDLLRISKEIKGLPHEISRVLVLKYMEGQSYEAIEARLGIKPYRIDYLIRKGKSLLKRRLKSKTP